MNKKTEKKKTAKKAKPAGRRDIKRAAPGQAGEAMKTFGKLEKIKKNLGRESKKAAAAEVLGFLGKTVPPGLDM